MKHGNPSVRTGNRSPPPCNDHLGRWVKPNIMTRQLFLWPVTCERLHLHFDPSRRPSQRPQTVFFGCPIHDSSRAKKKKTRQPVRCDFGAFLEGKAPRHLGGGCPRVLVGCARTLSAQQDFRLDVLTMLDVSSLMLSDAQLAELLGPCARSVRRAVLGGNRISEARRERSKRFGELTEHLTGQCLGGKSCWVVKAKSCWVISGKTSWKSEVQ